MKLHFAAAFAVLAATGASAAPLTLSIDGLAGSGQVTLTFGGSQEARVDGVFGDLGDNPVPDVISQFLELGEFNDFDTALFDVLSGVATFSVFDGLSTASQSLTAVLLDSDGGGSDDIGFSFGGPTLPFLAGDTISLSGQVVIGGLDLLDLRGGTFTSQVNPGDFSLSDALDLELTIPGVAPIPLPATLPLLGGTLLAFGLGLRRRSR